MKILFLTTDAFGGHGGIALYGRDLVQALASHPRAEEVVVVPRIIPNEPEPLPAKVRHVTKAARGRAAFLREVLRMRGQRFDLVICGHGNLLPLARIVTPHPVLMIYGVEAWKPLRDPLSKRIARHCRAVISISEITRDRFITWSKYTGRVYLLPNAIHTERYGIRPRNPELVARYRLEGKRVLLTVGRLESQERYKGFDEVMEAMPRLVEKHPDLVYLIAGGGNDFIRLQQKAHQLGLASHVRFTGLFPEREKPDLYGLADVYAMPSRGEGFGFVFLEAMASGIPVIASDSDGGREAVLGGKLGKLVNPSDREALERAILELLERPERRVPEGLSHFSFANFEQRVHAILDELTPLLSSRA